jgi:hypothetical protein
MDEMAGNEALLEMLDTDAAVEMLEWGKTLVASIVKQTEGMDDFAADLTLLPRLKAVRQTMRTVGNWAAGKYTDPASRVQLREKLLEYFRNIFGEKANLPAPARMDALIQEVDDQGNSPQQLILKLKDMLNHINTGDSNDVPTTHNQG